MAEGDNTDEKLSARLSDIGAGIAKKETHSSFSNGLMAIGAAGLAAGGVYIGSLLNSNSADTAPARETSITREFPEDTGSFGALAPVTRPAPEVRTEPVQNPEQARALKEMEGRLASLTDRLAAMAKETDANSQSALDALREGMSAELRTLKEQMDSSKDASDKIADNLTRELDNARTQANIERQAWDAQRISLENQLSNAQNRQSNIGPSTEDIAEQKRQAMLAERLRQQEAQFMARINSNMIAFSASGSSAVTTAEREMSDRESFVASSAKQVAVSVSTKITKPDITVVQGTIIQAALETAIDSTLPGTLRAIVSEDVHSFDGRNVLIPRGSKLFGEYQSDLSIADSRILVAWSRVVTPEGRTAVIASYGADDLGRSGTTGQVYRHFLKRFGAATMISIIGAAPTLASNQASNEAGQDALQNVSADLLGQTASVIGEYLSIPPTIRVDQGARISVILDRDLVMP